MTLEAFAALVVFYAAGFGVTYEKPSDLWPHGKGERIEVRQMAFDPRDLGMKKATVAWTAWHNDRCTREPDSLFCGGHWVVEVDSAWLRRATWEQAKFVAAHEAGHMVFTARGVRSTKQNEREVDGYARRACACMLPSTFTPPWPQITPGRFWLDDHSVTR